MSWHKPEDIYLRYHPGLTRTRNTVNEYECLSPFCCGLCTEVSLLWENPSPCLKGFSWPRLLLQDIVVIETCEVCVVFLGELCDKRRTIHCERSGWTPAGGRQDVTRNTTRLCQRVLVCTVEDNMNIRVKWMQVRRLTACYSSPAVRKRVGS